MTRKNERPDSFGMGPRHGLRPCSTSTEITVAILGAVFNSTPVLLCPHFEK